MNGSRSPRRSVVWTARVLAVGLSAALGIGAAEVILRVQASGAPRSGAGMRPIDPDTRGLHDIEGVFALAMPNQRARYRRALYETNSRGLRGGEYSTVAPAGTFRIEMIGDSFTMGSGVRVEEAYPALVEKALRGTGGSQAYEVINLGLSGLSLAGSLDQRLLPIGLDYAPDLLVYGFTVNDLEGPDYVPLTREAKKPSGSLLFDLLHARWDYTRDMLWPSASSYVRELDNNFFRNPAVWQRFERDLDRLAAIGRERRICVVVLLHTQLTALNSWHPFLRHYAAVAEAARARGMYVVESFPWFEGIDPDAYTCGIHDSHPNAWGHQILAEALLHSLRSLPPACWTHE
jgi:lysophospholipase L1-like esterase